MLDLIAPRTCATALLASMSLMVGSCGKTGDSGLETRRFALSASGQTILGFENPATDWQVTQGGVPALQSNSTHTQGSVSGAVKAKGYVVLKSTPFSVTQDVAGPLFYDLFLPTQQPNPFWLGASQLFVNCPSKGIFNAFLGQVELTGLATGTFNQLRFDMPSNQSAQLQGGCSDLSFSIAVNVPSNATGTYLLDNFHFGGSGGDIKATLNCITKITNSIYTAYFGYVSAENFIATLPFGTDNFVSPGPPPSGQPANFRPGTHVTEVGVDFAPTGNASWHLPSGTATATANSPQCPGSARQHVPCVGVPATTTAGCAIVVELPNPVGPQRNPAVQGDPFDPSTLPPGEPDDGEDGTEGATKATHWSPPSALTLAPGATSTSDIAVSQTSRVFVKILWQQPGTVTATVHEGTITLTGPPVILGPHSSSLSISGKLNSGTAQLTLVNPGAVSLAIKITLGVLPLPSAP